MKGKQNNTEGFIQLAKKCHGDKFDYSKVNYVHSKIPVKIICPEHGEFEQRPFSHLRNSTCPVCSTLKRKSKYLSYTECKALAQSNHIRSKSEWLNFCKNNKHLTNLPFYPNKIYKNFGWINADNFFDKKTFIKWPYAKARKFVRKLKLKNQIEWQNWFKSGNRPTYIPSNPEYHYRNKGWTGFQDWLGSNNISSKVKAKSFVTFDEFKTIVKEHKIQSHYKYEKIYKTLNFNLPSAPHLFYKDKGWTIWRDLLN